MVFKKFCTKHALEFIGETCPECEREKNTVVPDKPKKKRKHKNKNKNGKGDSGNGVRFEEKLKELVEKYK